MYNILILLYASYIMLAFSYTLEVFQDKEVCKKYWYIALLAFIWCFFIFWFYFPCDLGSKLYKKLK